jgi:hypothetical protein
LNARYDEILAHCPYERDLRTGERFPVAPELGGLGLAIRAQAAKCKEHEAALKALESPEARQQVDTLLGAFEIHPLAHQAQWAAEQDARAGQDLAVKLVTSGYGLVQDLEDRLFVRRMMLGFPEDADW